MSSLTGPMKILVPFKRVPDPDTRIRVTPDGSAVDLDGVKFSANPFDAIALEEALRIKERIGEAELVVVSIGGEECAEPLRVGLAMGADRALLVRSDLALDPLAIAKIPIDATSSVIPVSPARRSPTRDARYPEPGAVRLNVSGRHAIAHEVAATVNPKRDCTNSGVTMKPPM